MIRESHRDPLIGHLLTPENSALVIIDLQPTRVVSVRSMEIALMAKNVVSLARIAKTFWLPIWLSTVNQANGYAPDGLGARGGARRQPRVRRTKHQGVQKAHRAGLRRIEAAGAQPVSWVSVATEMQRDWTRTDNVVDIPQIVIVDRLLKE